MKSSSTSLVYENLCKLFDVFQVFLRLGLTSFGGPIAHLGYFQTEFVIRRQWIDEKFFADLVALCQFLPGPTSSQVGFSLGILRAGLSGGCAAWLGFTLPSVLIMISFAYGATFIQKYIGLGIFHGLKIVAIAIVAQAVVGMSRTLCPDWIRAGIALTATILAINLSDSSGQILIIALGALAGIMCCRSTPLEATGYLSGIPSKKTGAIALILFFLLLFSLPIFTHLLQSHTLAVINAFFRSGALVFGGGHVVLPVLQTEVVQTGLIDRNVFLSGYGAAQAIPGPLFSFASYLGILMIDPPNGLAGGIICLISLFLPGILLLVGFLPFWDNLRKHIRIQSAMRGVGASVVGILAAALYTPLWTTTIYTACDAVVVLICFILLTILKLPAWSVVIMSALGGMILPGL